MKNVDAMTKIACFSLYKFDKKCNLKCNLINLMKNVDSQYD